jgi:glutathione S-transferase
MSLRLVIANKNYSSWSMRPWLALHAAGIAFEEVMLEFDTPAWETRVPAATPSGRVPVLWVDGVAVWDSLAILETVAELQPEAGLWPRDPVARMRARSLAAEMHSGFTELRTHMPMNIRARHPGKGRTPAVLRDIDRIFAAWDECRSARDRGGDFLFGAFGNVDAMFAPVAMRFVTYEVELPEPAAGYVAALREHPSVRAWVEAALREHAVVAHDEPYAVTAGGPATPG